METWTLWYHDPECQDYSVASYSNVGDVGTPAEFWTMINALPKDAWDNGMFFFMKGAPVAGVEPPTWEKGNYPIPDALKRAGYRDDDDKPETEENGSPAQETEEQNGSAHENGESSNTVRAHS